MSDIRGDIELGKQDITNSPQSYPETTLVNQKLSWFQDQKLGVIFHWGLYAVAGIVESWELSEADDWARRPGWRSDIETLQRDYFNMIEDFNPVDFDPVAWAKVCRRAGYKYMIFTTKHHDGFHLWDTAQSDYKVNSVRSLFKRDIFKEVVEAFRAEGLGIGIYYSKADWYSELYWSQPHTVKSRRADYDTTQEPERWQAYVDYVHAELEELTQNYGPIDILWLDAGWCGQGKEDLRMDELAIKVRKTNPDLLIVDRMMGGRHENYVTPERKIPQVADIPTKPWESNIPYGADWGWTHGDQYKSSRELILSVIDVVSKGGNIILGFGPTAKGLFTPGQLAICQDLGQFTHRFGDGIYGTRPLNYQVDDRTLYVTQAGQTLYVFYPFEVVPTQLQLPKVALDHQVVAKANLVFTDGPLVCQDIGDAYTVLLPHTEHFMNIAVVKLTLQA